MVKNEWGFIDHLTPRSVVSHKWYDELSRLIEWFFDADWMIFDADSDGIIFGLTANLCCNFDI